ncbi:hypothetical protein VPHD81_0074 [Vibrio phage D81]
MTKQKKNSYNFHPRTSPTEEQLVEMKKETRRLVSAFSAPGVAHLLKLEGITITRQGVNVWLARGRISAYAAHKICQHKDVREKGFTRESLRPDVPVWYIDGEE